MGYIAGVLDKEGGDASPRLLTMLQNASKGNASSYGVADAGDAETFKDTPVSTVIENPVLIGAKNIHPQSPSSPINQGNNSLAFTGILYDTSFPGTLSAANELEKDVQQGIHHLIKERQGAFTMVAIQGEELFCGLDHIGTISLYYGENQSTIAIATNKRMLWSIDIDPKPIPPGNLLKVSNSKIKMAQVKKIQPSTPKTQYNSIGELDKIFNEASEIFAKKVREGVVAFSGGVDSAVVAHYLDRAGVGLSLVTVGLEGKKELGIAEQAADSLGLPITIKEYTDEDVETHLNEILYSVEEPHPMKVGVAYPFHWASRITANMRQGYLFSGNGADELFGGYKKYLTAYIQDKNPVKMMFNDVSHSWINNYHRDTKTCLDQGINLILPFAFPKLVEFGLGVPITKKINGDTGQRKVILRKLAQRAGLPDEIALRPKKAAQYSTGVNKSLKKLAKKHGKHMRDLLKDRFKHLNKE